MPFFSAKTEAIINRFFSRPERASVRRLLIDRCGNNLPCFEKADETELERIRFAVLKISRGDPERLARAVQRANEDWRDLLMEADFGNGLQAREKWASDVNSRWRPGSWRCGKNANRSNGRIFLDRVGG